MHHSGKSTSVNVDCLTDCVSLLKLVRTLFDASHVHFRQALNPLNTYVGDTVAGIVMPTS